MKLSFRGTRTQLCSPSSRFGLVVPPGDGAEENFLREGQFFSDDVKAGRVKKILAEQELSESAIEVDSERADCRS